MKLAASVGIAVVLFATGAFAQKSADTVRIALNQPINVAVAEKLSALRTANYFRECVPTWPRFRPEA